MKLIRNVHVYAPQDLGIRDVLVCGSRFEDVRDRIDIRYDRLETEEASGRIMIPGLIDQHVHVIGGGGEDGYASLIREISVKDCVTCGVTSVVGLLGTDGIVKGMEALIAKTKALKEQGISAWCLTGSYAVPSVTLTGSVGKDIAMIEEVIGVKTAISDHRSSCPTAQELARLASQARTAGLLAGKPGFVHLHTGRGKSGLKDVMRILDETDLPVSQFRPTHMGNQLEDAVAFAGRGGMIDFTAGEGTAADIRKAMQETELSRITMSSDANGSMPVWDENKKLIGMGVGKMDTLLETVRQLIRDGVSMEDALSVVTCNVAEGLGLHGRKGIIKAGADADYVLLDQDLQIVSVDAMGKRVVENGKFCGREYYSC